MQLSGRTRPVVSILVLLAPIHSYQGTTVQHLTRWRRASGSRRSVNRGITSNYGGLCSSTTRRHCNLDETSSGFVDKPVPLNNNDHTESDIRRGIKYQQLMDASKLSLAPMMDYTDRHFRHLVRLISSRTLLYTEMVAANAIAHERQKSVDAWYNCNNNVAQQERCGMPLQPANNNDVERQVLLADAIANYDDQYLQRYLAQGRYTDVHEGPSVLQLGGSDPQQLHDAAQTVMELTERGRCDYTALNLNCGCPSPKVAGKGCFGAALMDDPKLVAILTQALHEGSGGNLPVTVKCRIGTDTKHPFTKVGPQPDPEEEYDTLCRFIDTVASGGVVTDFAVHARIAVLQKSYSPAENRKVPPLRYDFVRRLIQDFPHLTFTLNGGINTLAEVQAQFDAAPKLKGVMVGRAWVADPWSFAMTDQLVYGKEEVSSSTTRPKNRLQILEAYGRHADMEEANGEPDKIRRFIVKAISPLFTGETNAKRYRIALDEIAGLPKKLKQQGKTLAGQPPLSELIMTAATQHISTEALLRTPQESYERLLWAEEQHRKRRLNDDNGRSAAIREWQAVRDESAEQATDISQDVATGG